MKEIHPRVLRSPKPMVDPDNGLAFFTNAKCGGTTLKHWFLSSPKFHRMIRSPLDPFRHFRSKTISKSFIKVRTLSRKYQQDPTDKLARKFINHYRQLFTHIDSSPMSSQMANYLVIRNPYSRAVSSFVNKFCGEDREKEFVRHVIDICGVDSPTFIDFLNYVERTQSSVMDPHWRRQTYIIDGISNVTFLKLESLESDMEQHAEVWGDRDSNILAAKTQSNNYESQLDGYSVPNMSADQLVQFKDKNGAFPEKSYFLTPEVKDLIRSAYRKDFERFQYAHI